MALPRRALVIAGLLVAAAAAYGVPRYRESQLSPFRLWDFRAGTPFRPMDEQALREAGRRYKCAPFDTPGAGTSCILETRGIRGQVSLVLDASGRAIVIRFASPDGSQRMRDEMRKVGAEWGLVSQPRRLSYTAADGTPFEAMHWLTSDGRWSASMMQRTEPDTLTAVTLRNERALARMYASAPLAQLTHAMHHLVNPLTEGQRHALVQRPVSTVSRSPAGAEVGTGNGTQGGGGPVENARRGELLAAAARRLPACRPSEVDTIGRWPHRFPAQHLPPALVKDAVELAFPGMSLILDSGPYLVHANGRPELVQLSGHVADAEARVAAFGLTFPRRISQIPESSAPTCGAPAQMIVIRLDAAGAVVDARPFTVAADAIWSNIRDVRMFHEGDRQGELAIEVMSVAGYATAEWIGEIYWEERTFVDGLDTYVRSPVAAGRKNHRDGRELGGQLLVEDVTATTVEFTVMRLQEGSDSALVAPLIMPHENGRLNGWILLLTL